MWQTEQVCVPGMGMWPFGSVVGVVQTVVLWHSEQSPWPGSRGLGAEM